VLSYCHYFLERCHLIVLIYLLIKNKLFSINSFYWLYLPPFFALFGCSWTKADFVQFRTFFPATFIVLPFLWTDYLTFLVFIHAALHLYLYYISSVTCYLCIYVVSVVFCIFECSAHITLAFTCVILWESLDLWLLTPIILAFIMSSYFLFLLIFYLWLC
jgi:hypothetical protein